ncbi:SpoIID/LytB domain-containing protein [Candidatus Peregrinibacteria bacterium]|nr:SpoIID/LytB domain-containing protein [Candidatus Peregrinibacteria bacterium]
MNALKKIAKYAGFSIVLLFVFTFSAEFESQSINHVATNGDNQVITIQSRFLASISQLPEPYKTMDLFVSPVQTSDFDFTSIGFSWDEIAPPGTHVIARVKLKIDGKWTDWLEMEGEPDLFNNDKKAAMVITNPATTFQYEYLLYGDGNKVPLVKNSQWTFLKTGEKPRYLADAGIDDLKNIALNTKDPEVISRADWGADESYRYLADNNAIPQLVQLDPDFYNKYANELQYSHVVEADDSGNKYKWPLQYPEKVEKIIIHHTATTGNLDNPKQAIRDIYYYHAITRGWGDIGYNYLVDQQGNIYEGRYGGEGVIGAHAGPGNHGSIGISFLGDFEQSDVPQGAMIKGSKFIYKKTKMHGIDTIGESEFRGKIRPNLFAHRDIMSTDCPGQFLYEKLPLLRLLASQNFNLKPKFVKDYDYQDTSDVYYLELKPNEQKEITLKLQNIGKNSWNDKTYLRMDDSLDFDGVVTFPGRQGNTISTMQESVVNSGDTATFKFQVQAGKKAKTVYLNISPHMSGKNTVPDHIVIPISVQPPIYKYELIDSKFPPKLMKANDTFSGSITLKNDGNITWENDGGSNIKLQGGSLGTIASLQEKSVAPGQNGTFNFTFKTDEKPGYYKEIFIPVMEGATWISKDQVSFETIIYEREYDSELLSKTITKNWERGSSYNLSISLRNIGMETWTADNLKTTFVRNKDLSVSNIGMSQSKVAPGETGTIDFTIKISAEADGGKNVLLVTPKMGTEKFVTTPLYFYYQIKDKELQTGSDSSNAGGMIRIKLGFDGDPQITANGSFKIYSGNSFLSTLSAGETAKIGEENGGYRVDAGGATFLKSDPIRFVPDSNAILKITNFSRKDNEFRGILEVRDDHDGLVTINELALEDYMKGIAEEPNDEPYEKIKAIMVAARTYADFYMTIDKKFPGEPYDLDDSPDVSQYYLGYDFEKRAPNVVAAIQETTGQVITYNGKIVKTPFFSRSDGTRTKSAQEVWGWTDKPYLVSVDDSYCKGSDSFSGHGVGLSGCGARGMAEAGKTYKEILLHYYNGVEIKILY